MSTILEVTDLKVHFPVRRGLLQREVGAVRAVDGVSFSVDEGKTLGVVGESGCGKSTTARAILRLVEPTGGTVRVAGEDVTVMDRGALRAHRRQMQMIFQDPYASLNPRMTVEEIISEPLRTHGVVDKGAPMRTRVRELLDQVGLPASAMRRYPHEFSGGQRQRVGIARAVALSPALILADEPVSALDMSIRAQIINLMVDLQRELGVAYLFIAHDLAVVRHICDEVAVMYLGRVVERAPSEALYRGPRHPYTQALMSAVPRPNPKEERKRRRLVLVGDVPSPLDPPPGCAFHPRCPYAFDRCREETPALVDDAGHHLACHLDEPPSG